ncbi:unnamed protein product [Linum trigynum]|uniref:Uncharacterized protein n=1 Tax=Linum trigynum TaxID=586398 RepID=A0AAV2GV04_9ROSI
MLHPSPSLSRRGLPSPTLSPASPLRDSASRDSGLPFPPLRLLFPYRRLTISTIKTSPSRTLLLPLSSSPPQSPPARHRPPSPNSPSVIESAVESSVSRKESTEVDLAPCMFGLLAESARSTSSSPIDIPRLLDLPRHRRQSQVQSGSGDYLFFVNDD